MWLFSGSARTDPHHLHVAVISENRDKVETYLAFGASRFEACKPIATDALRLALTPNVNQMRCAEFPPFSPKVDS